MHLSEAQTHTHKAQAIASLAQARETYFITPLINHLWLKVLNVSENEVKEGRYNSIVFLMIYIVLKVLNTSKTIIKK